jgi:hypothetical protein
LGTPETDTDGVTVFGGPVGVTEFDGADAAPVPAALVAVTVNVTGVPLARPGTVANVRTSGVATVCPVEAVTV